MQHGELPELRPVGVEEVEEVPKCRFRSAKEALQLLAGGAYAVGASASAPSAPSAPCPSLSEAQRKGKAKCKRNAKAKESRVRHYERVESERCNSSGLEAELGEWVARRCPALSFRSSQEPDTARLEMAGSQLESHSSKRM